MCMATTPMLFWSTRHCPPAAATGDVTMVVMRIGRRKK
ncbi:hypothetical protein A2U01_0060399, partial [Trifolium medium]|nr:hypothetical protein [Trifolium medium]